MYEAIVNIPGYLPWADEPALFETAREAWDYLIEEHERQVDDAEAWETDDGIEEARTFDGEGVIYAKTPGYDGSHDLGLAYSVQIAEES